MILDIKFITKNNDSSTLIFMNPSRNVFKIKLNLTQSEYY